MEEQTQINNTNIKCNHKIWPFLVGISVLTVYSLLLTINLLTKSFSQKTDNLNTANNTDTELIDDICKKKHIGDVSWTSFLVTKESALYYNEIREKDGLLCENKIYDIPKNFMVQNPEIHIKDNKISFLLSEYMYEDSSQSQTAQFIIVDLLTNNINQTGVELPFASNINTIRTNNYQSGYLVSYPVLLGGCGIDNEDCWEKELAGFKELWGKSSIYILNLNGDVHEIPANTLPTESTFIFDNSSSPNLIVLTGFEEKYQINTVINLDSLFE